MTRTSITKSRSGHYTATANCQGYKQKAGKLSCLAAARAALPELVADVEARANAASEAQKLRNTSGVFQEASDGEDRPSASIKIVTDPEYAEPGKVLLVAQKHGEVVVVYLDAKTAEAFAGAILRAANAERMEQEQLVTELRSALSAALEWIDAVPTGTPLPPMPGFDRDWAEGLLAGQVSQANVLEAALRQNEAKRQELALIADDVADLARALTGDNVQPSGRWGSTRVWR